MAIIAQRISSKYFSFYAKCTEGHPYFNTEVSYLPENFDFLSQVYDDACDAGFTMVSAETGNEITFYHSSTDIEDDEIMGWHFKITPESARKFPRLANLSVLIIND